MKIYMIGYDLNKPAKDYPKLIDAIEKKYPKNWHFLDSTWLVKTADSAQEIRDILNLYIDSDDELLVARLSANGDAAWSGFSAKAGNWLGDNL